MHRNILRRIERLEQTAGTSANRLPILFFHFTKNKTTNAANRAQSNGRKWQREPGEGAEDFQARVVTIARCPLINVAMERSTATSSMRTDASTLTRP
jgi:hypothetical protein